MSKMSRVCLIFTFGNDAIVNNYRPISVICNFEKVLKIVISNFIYSNIKVYPPPFQHGFIEQRSTITNFAVFTHYLAESLDAQAQVDVVYIVFQKAFNPLNHHILLHKLYYFGISNSIKHCFSSG